MPRPAGTFPPNRLRTVLPRPVLGRPARSPCGSQGLSEFPAARNGKLRGPDVPRLNMQMSNRTSGGAPTEQEQQSDRTRKHQCRWLGDSACAAG